MNQARTSTVHPNLELYYDAATDRSAVDAHLATCDTCWAWLADIDERLRDLPCNQLVELVTEYLDDFVDARTRARIDDHLHLCEGCRNYLEQMRASLATIGRITRQPEPPEPVRAVLLAAFRSWRRDASDRRPDA